MNELQLWSLMHMSEVGGVALGDADPVGKGDQEMMLGLYAFNEEEVEEGGGDWSPDAPPITASEEFAGILMTVVF